MRPVPGTSNIERGFRTEMTSDDIEVLVRDKTRNKLHLQLLEERQGNEVAFLSYSIDEQNQMTIWHTGVPPFMRHTGAGGRLVEKALGVAQANGSKLRIVCPFAKSYVARHPELKKRYGILSEAVLDNESLFGDAKSDDR
jgi:uncharacterized protein